MYVSSANLLDLYLYSPNSCITGEYKTHTPIPSLNHVPVLGSFRIYRHSYQTIYKPALKNCV